MNASDNKKAYDLKYEKNNMRQVKLNINRKTEADLLEWIEKQDNIQGYIKSLIRKDMENNEKGQP